VYFGGRGGGKSQAVALALLVMGMQRTLRILCTRELQASIADSVHRLLSDLISKHGLESHYEVLQTTIRGVNGTEFLFKGLKHNITEIKGLEGVDVCWVEEAENISERSWELLIPTIRKEGSEIWIVLNPRNATDPTYQRFIATQHDDVLLEKVSWRDNPFFPSVLRAEMEKLKQTDHEAFQHIWEGELDTRRSGAVYAKQLTKAREDGRITKVPYDPQYEVFTAWDLGFGDSTAIWWLQFVGRELRWLDCYENSGEQLDHYTKIIKEKPYNYMKNGHFLPHDGGSGNIHGDSVSRQLFNMGVPNTVLTRETDISPGIELLRQTIQYSVFDADKCSEGIKALDAYGYEWDAERAVFKGKPRHDWSSHYADAARYAARAAGIAKSGISIAKPVSFIQKRTYGGSFMGA
jgi:phage terminase large subunit